MGEVISAVLLHSKVTKVNSVISNTSNKLKVRIFHHKDMINVSGDDFAKYPCIEKSHYSI
jgi:hypothetical protein